MARPCGVVKKKINFFAEMFCLTQGQGKITNECSSPSPPELSSSLLSPPHASSSTSWFPPYVFPPSRVPAFQGPCLALSQEVQELLASTTHLHPSPMFFRIYVGLIVFQWLIDIRGESATNCNELCLPTQGQIILGGGDPIFVFCLLDKK